MPRHPTKFLVTEWDDTKEVVTLLAHTGEMVTYQHLTGRPDLFVVPADYFFTTLSAKEVTPWLID